MQFKVGERVIVEKSNVSSWKYNGKTGVIDAVDMGYEFPYHIEMDDGSSPSWCTVKCLVEDTEMFTKADLKDGMIVEYRNGTRRLVLNGKFMGKNFFAYIDDYCNDLTNPFEIERDIVKVYESDGNILDKLFKDGFLKLIWERQTPAKEMTIAEIEKVLGYPIKVVKE